MSPIEVVQADSRAGRRAVERLVRRGETVLDAKTLSRAQKIVQEVRRKGDSGLLDHARRLDGVEAESVAELALSPLDGDAADGAGLPAGFVEALERAIVAVERFHAPQVRTGYRQESEGVELEERIVPLQRVGLYVPGGRASYPLDGGDDRGPRPGGGGQEIAVATPPAAYRANPALRYTLARLGVTEIWGMGGAHAIAAFAYGTETIRRVDKIAGPGNAWVTAAKKLVVGDVGIDGLAGPSEVVIVADPGADPEEVAADLLAQAEHDPLAAAVLITTDAKLARQVSAEIDRQLAAPALASTAETARAALAAFGVALVVDGLEEALDLVERLAPEHLQLVGREAEVLALHVRAAGAVFVGAATPEVFGDYIAGPSHVLPTCGSARFASALGVEDFLRRSHTVRFTPVAASHRAAAAAALADAEGLPAHAAAARRRLR